MTPEEKAKRYDETLEQLKGLIEGTREDKRAILEEDLIDIFYELKESEDERIRKALIDLVKCNERSGYFVLNNVSTGSMIAWLEKQGQVKEYTFKSIPRLLEMVEPTERAKAYCQKLMDTLVKEGYVADAKIVEECLKKMSSEKVALATMDDQKINKSEDERIRKVLVGFFKSYKEQGTCGAETFNGIPTDNILAWLEKQGKLKWTKEDECYMGECISAVATKDGWSFEEKRKTKHWLESLKLRLQ